MNKPVELWGTFSVVDHLRPQPFIMDVLLYDRLVIPVPKARHREDEWRNHWKIERLSRQLGILKNLAVQMPWGPEETDNAQQHYLSKISRLEATSLVNEDIRAIQSVDPDAPDFFATRQILADYANKKLDNKLFRSLKARIKKAGTEIEAVTAYDSPKEMHDGLGIQPLKQVEGDHPFIVPAAVFNWTIHTPVGEKPLKLLKQATKLANRPDFREHRSYFYKWLRDPEILDLGMNSVKIELYKRLADYEDVMKKQGWNTEVRQATQVLMIPATILALYDQNSSSLAAAGIGIAAYYMTYLKKTPEPNESTQVAAMAYDIRKEFGDCLDYKIWS